VRQVTDSRYNDYHVERCSTSTDDATARTPPERNRMASSRAFAISADAAVACDIIHNATILRQRREIFRRDAAMTTCHCCLSAVPVLQNLHIRSAAFRDPRDGEHLQNANGLAERLS